MMRAVVRRAEAPRTISVGDVFRHSAPESAGHDGIVDDAVDDDAGAAVRTLVTTLSVRGAGGGEAQESDAIMEDVVRARRPDR